MRTSNPQPPPGVTAAPPPCDCSADPVGGLKAMFVDYAQGRAIEAGRDPATRPVFLRLHGVAHGTFQIVEGLADDLREGLFGQKSAYPAWVRFSSDLQPGAPDLKGTCGIGIKLFGVEGEKSLAPEEDATTADLLLQNMDVFFADTATDMCEFTQASLNGKGAAYLKEHPRTAEILDAMKKVVPSVVETPYWSGIPFRFGDRYAKYKLEPEAAPPASAPPDYDDPFYLRADLHDRLRRGEVRYRFLVQLRTDDAAMPLDAATVAWSEEASPPVHVATLVLPPQDLDARGQSAYGERLAFNPWRALEANEPVGTIADARKVAYRASAAQRRDVNGEPVGEPAVPRPATWREGQPFPAPVDQHVVRAEIHPAVGVIRVGDSDEWYLGPEVSPLPPVPAGSRRSSDGRLKRQAAKFRVYGYNAAGEVVRELTDDWADVRWTAHVANRKAAWYQWVIALDIPEAKGTVCPRRNPTVKGKDREGLAIDSGPVTISGAGTTGDAYALGGTFRWSDGERGPFEAAVPLGRLETDDAGRLVVVPANGTSASPGDDPIYDETQPNPFINANGWYDDVCDGPITAAVTVEGRAIPCEPAWVVGAPPNYAPDVISVRTLYDLLFDLYVQAGWLPFPDALSFRRDVYPILRRFSALGWVNRGFFVQYGPSGPFPLDDDAFMRRLSGDGPTSAELRRQIVNGFRDPDDPSPSQALWPWIYGDAMSVPSGNSPRENATVSPTQYRILQLWAAGKVADDWDDPAPLPAALADVPLADQPDTLTRAALEDALADAFHPGCEVTWPVRHLSMWRAPFRLKHRPAGAPQPDYGSQLSVRDALASFGPLYAQGPGDLSQWMGLPWQADTAFCRSGYDTRYDPYVPTFWPATVPNQVLSAEAYDALMAAETPEARAEAFAQRANWTRFLTQNGSATGQQMETMVQIFGSLGVLEQRPGPDGDPAIPSVLQVESLGPDVKQTAAAQAGDTALKAHPAKRSMAEAVSGKDPGSGKKPGKAPATAPTSGKASAAFADADAELARAVPADASFESHEAAQAAPLPTPQGR